MNIQLPSGAEEGCLVYALDDFAGWNLPWKVNEGRRADLGRGRYMFMDRSAERRFGPFAVGDYREILGRRFKIIGTTSEAASFTTAPIVFMDYGNAQELSQSLQGKTSYILVKTAPGADPQAVAAAIRRVVPYNDVYTKAEWARRSRSYWVVSTGLGMNMGVTVFLGILVGHRGRGADAVHLGGRAREGVRDGEGHRRLQLGHLPHPGRAGADRGRGGLRGGRRDLLRAAAGHGRRCT